MTQWLQSRSVGQVLSVLTVGFVLLAALIFYLAHVTAPPAATAAVGATDPILEIYDDSLTSYLPTSATSTHDLYPGILQRGVAIDGSLRVGKVGFRVAGNPFPHAQLPSQQTGLVNLATGNHDINEVDIALPSEGPVWIVGRSYNAVQLDGTDHHDSDGVQGRNWFQTSMPEIALFEGDTDDEDVLYLYYGATAFLEFQRVDATSDHFRGINGTAGIVEHAAKAEAGDSDTYKYTDQHGNEMWFFGWDESFNSAGQLWKMVDPGGNAAYVGDEDDTSDAYDNGFLAGTGLIEYAYDEEGRRYSYAYLTYSGKKVLRWVDVEEYVASAWVQRAKVTYNYYATLDSGKGDVRDFKRAIVYVVLPDANTAYLRAQYYRYYTDSNGSGHKHAIKYFLDHEGILSSNSENSVNSYLNVAVVDEEHDLEPYASAYFEYDSNHRVSLAWFRQGCGCAGGGSDTDYAYEYEDDGAANGSGYQNSWETRTIVSRPDQSYVIQYFDEVGQPLTTILSDDEAPTTGDSVWAHKVVRNTNGIVTELHTPANMSSYTHSSGVVASQSSDGLITTYDLETAGATKHYALARRWKVGDTSTDRYYEASWEYETASLNVGDGNYVVRPLVNVRTLFANKTTAGTGGDTYEMTNTMHSDSLVLAQVDTELPVVTTSNNGAGGSTGDVTKKHFDTIGRVDYAMSTGGRITNYQYEKGLLKKKIEDVDTAQITGEPAGFDSNGTGTELHLATSYTYDAQGRLTETTLPDQRIVKRYYTRTAPHRPTVLTYTDYDASPVKFYGPISFTTTDQHGRVREQGTIGLNNAGTLDETDTALSSHVEYDDDIVDAVSSFSDAAVTALTTFQYDNTGSQLESTRTYYTIPTTMPGTYTANFVETSYDYDAMGRQTVTKERAGSDHETIYETHYDVIGRFEKREIGTDNSGLGSDDMVIVELVEYDGTGDGENSLVTKRTLRVEDDNNNERVTTYDYDDHGNIEREVRPEAPYYVHKYDNQMRRVATAQYSSSPTLPLDPTTSGTQTNRVALQETAYDELGRPWKRTRHKVKQSDGDNTDTLTSETWYDKEGRVAKVDGEQLVKYGYDRIGRRTHTYVLASDNDTNYATSIDDTTAKADGDVVLEERQQIYADNSDEVMLTAVIERSHTETSHTGALDSNADGDPLKYTLTATSPAVADVKGRIQIQASWHDFLGRTTTSVEYGTNGGATFTRPTDPPTSGTDILITDYDYASSGRLETTTDPMGVEYYREYDASGQVTKTIDDKDDGSAPAEIARTTEYTYTNGLRTLLRNKLPTSNQDTVYTYGTSTGSGATDSEIATGHLLSEIQYPDHDSQATPDDVVTLAYNTQQELIAREDQAGNLIDVTYDLSGRVAARKAENVATGFDDSVERIEYAYNARGLLEAVTQYDAPSSGNEVDDIEYAYGDWGELTTIQQDHNSGVGDSGSVDDFEVSYSYDKATGGRNTLRRSTMTLPSGESIGYSYAVGYDADASRVTEVKSGGTVLASYKYLGSNTAIGMDYPVPDVWSRMYDSSNDYDAHLDRFNRVTNWKWTKDLSTDTDFYDVEYEYDKNSNVTLMIDNIHKDELENGVFDVEYTVDALNRVTRAKEGEWTGSAISPTERDQEWTLSNTGTWDVMKLDLDGNGSYTGTDELEDTRVYNEANELETRDTNSSGPVEHTLVYDAAGNLTDDGDKTTYKYDAFYRLVEVKHDSNLVATYAYNGLGQLTSEHADVTGDGNVNSSDPVYHNVQDMYGRDVATYREPSTGGIDSDPKEEFVHHAYGKSGPTDNMLILRNRDTDAWTIAASGSLADTVYYCQNAPDVVALIDDDGNIVEWIKYSTTGTPTCIKPGDMNSDGEVTEAEAGALAETSPYDVRADVVFDRTLDNENDEANAVEGTWGRGVLSSVGNGFGWEGNRWFEDTGLMKRSGVVDELLLGWKGNRWSEDKGQRGLRIEGGHWYSPLLGLFLDATIGVGPELPLQDDGWRPPMVPPRPRPQPTTPTPQYFYCDPSALAGCAAAALTEWAEMTQGFRQQLQLARADRVQPGGSMPGPGGGGGDWDEGMLRRTPLGEQSYASLRLELLDQMCQEAGRIAAQLLACYAQHCPAKAADGAATARGMQNSSCTMGALGDL